MLRYALTNLRANLTRLISTALAVIIGIGFLAAGLMLTDAMRAALTGTVDLEGLPAALEALEHRQVSGRLVLVP